MGRVGQPGQAQQHERQLERPPAPVLRYVQPPQQTAHVSPTDRPAWPGPARCGPAAAPSPDWRTGTPPGRSRYRAAGRSPGPAGPRPPAPAPAPPVPPGSTGRPPDRPPAAAAWASSHARYPAISGRSRPDQLVAGQLRAAQRATCPAPGPARFPGTTSGTSAAGKQVVASCQARVLAIPHLGVDRALPSVRIIAGPAGAAAPGAAAHHPGRPADRTAPGRCARRRSPDARPARSRSAATW